MLGTPYQSPEPALPFSYCANDRMEPVIFLSQPRSATTSVIGVRRPWAASCPPSALPLLNSTTSGTSLPDSVIFALCRTASKLVC
jgi:hypothetical protein